MLWNGIQWRTKFCHSNNFQHPALTISHPQILTTESQILCLPSKWEPWDWNPTWLKQELWHLNSVVLIRKLLRPYVVELWPSMPQPRSQKTLSERVISSGSVSKSQQSARRGFAPREARPGEGELCWALPHNSTHCGQPESSLRAHT